MSAFVFVLFFWQAADAGASYYLIVVSVAFILDDTTV